MTMKNLKNALMDYLRSNDIYMRLFKIFLFVFIELEF